MFNINFTRKKAIIKSFTIGLFRHGCNLRGFEVMRNVTLEQIQFFLFNFLPLGTWCVCALVIIEYELAKTIIESGD